MATITSPRPSITSTRSAASSRRPSLEIPGGSVRGTSPNPPLGSTVQRRNRAALRDYYNLRPVHNDPNSPSGNRSPSPRPPSPTSHPLPSLNNGATPSLDSPDFDASSYINSLLQTTPLSEILATESSLISQIRNLDGERKALVYDNYSKLIRATETIGKMRGSMETMGESGVGMKTLGPAVGFVAETAGSILRDMEGVKGGRARKGKNLVKWVLDTPERLKELEQGGDEQEAERQWAVVKTLLDGWKAKGVQGVEEVTAECEVIMVRIRRSSSIEEEESEEADGE